MLRVVPTKIALTTAALVVAVIGFVAASPAFASSTYLYANSGHARICSQIGCPSFAMVYNGTPFTMRCWTDSTWYDGNYWTNRWFWGTAHTTAGAYNVWVSASYVGNQVGVGHC